MTYNWTFLLLHNHVVQLYPLHLDKLLTLIGNLVMIWQARYHFFSFHLWLDHCLTRPTCFSTRPMHFHFQNIWQLAAPFRVKQPRVKCQCWFNLKLRKTVQQTLPSISLVNTTININRNKRWFCLRVHKVSKVQIQSLIRYRYKSGYRYIIGYRYKSGYRYRIQIHDTDTGYISIYIYIFFCIQ